MTDFAYSMHCLVVAVVFVVIVVVVVVCAVVVFVPFRRRTIATDCVVSLAGLGCLEPAAQQVDRLHPLRDRALP